MLKERTGIKLDSGKEYKITVDELLKEYEIKGLSLGDLQEKYVDMVDDYEEKISELKEDKEELNNTVNDLSERITELTHTIENQDNRYDENTSSDKIDEISGEIIFVVFIIAVIIAFFLGKRSKK